MEFKVDVLQLSSPAVREHAVDCATHCQGTVHAHFRLVNSFGHSEVQVVPEAA